MILTTIFLLAANSVKVVFRVNTLLQVSLITPHFNSYINEYGEELII